MMRFTKIIGLSISLFIGAIPIVVAQTIYVSPTGDDSSGNGTEGSPYTTFQKAVDEVATGNASTVLFANGDYYFDQTVILSQNHNNAVFKASGNSVKFHSLKQVTGWSVHNDNVMVAPLPDGISHVRYLHDKSENWMERSTTDSFSTTEAAGGDDDGCIECNNYTASTQADMSNIRYPGSFAAPDWADVAQYDLRASTLPWAMDVIPLASENTGQSRIYTAVPALYDLRKDVDEIAPTAWILNSIEGIDTPGEWASLNENIYLYPKSGTDDIYVPKLTELILIDDGTVDGNADVSNPVTGITFDGIIFTGGDFRILQSDDVTVQHDWATVDEPDALLRIRNASNITVQNCTFEKSGGTGLKIDRYAQNHTIVNNTLAYLGIGGINVVGRGPGHGDVSKNNEISNNNLQYIGMEQWASVAILLDNSSNNLVSQNYIANTYFTGVAVLGPRQLMFAAWAEGGDSFYVGREFHFRELEPSIVAFMNANGGVETGSEEAMQFVYNYDNRIEENYFIDVCTGQDIFLNGQFYISGATKGISPDIKTNYIERNYFYDSYNHSTNDYAIYSDSDQEDCNYTGNMISGILNADNQPFPAPIILAFNQWAESDNQGAGQITLRANITENSTFCNDTECNHTIGIDFVEEGAVINGVGGDAQFLSIYQQMFTSIREENLSHLATALPGVQAMRDRLSTIITDLGGTIVGSESVTACESYFWEGITYTTSGDYTITLTNTAGLDSLATLTLTILESTSGSESVTVCESYDWEGNTYTTSGDYTTSWTNTVGCDSLAALTLTILESTSGSESVSVCGSYEFEGGVLTTSGTYEATLLNQNNCDSLVTLNLTIFEEPSAAVSLNDNVLIAEDQSGVTFQWINCDTDEEIEGETNVQLTALITGNYAVEISNENCTVISECNFTDIILAIEDEDVLNFNIYPNPNNGNFTIYLNENPNEVEISIFNILGINVKTIKKHNNSIIDVAIEGKAGVYFIQITEEGKASNTIRIIKQ